MRAYLSKAQLSDAHLEGAFLLDAHLEGAYLRGAHLEGANLDGAHFEGTDLSDTVGLAAAQLVMAHGDARTRLPGSIARPPHWAPPAPAEPPKSR